MANKYATTLPPRDQTPAASATEQQAARAAAFAALYEAQFGRVYAFLRYRLCGAQLAEDLAAETFARAWDKLRDPADPRAVAWLFVTARNLVANHYRRHRRSVPWDEAASRALDLQTGDEPEDRLLERERRTRLARWLGALSEREREVIGLRYVAGLQNREIAPILRMREGNVAKIIHRALAKVRQRLRAEKILPERETNHVAP